MKSIIKFLKRPLYWLGILKRPVYGKSIVIEISDDNGKTWKEMNCIDEDSFNSKFRQSSYPKIIDGLENWSTRIDTSSFDN